MFKRNLAVWRIVGAVLLVGLLVGGGYLAYQAGVAQGLRQAPEMAEVFSQALESGQYPMGQVGGFRAPMAGYGIHSRGFLPIGGIFGLIAMVFVVGGLVRLIFFSRRAHAWGYPPHGPMRDGRWGGPWAGYRGEPGTGETEKNPEEKVE